MFDQDIEEGEEMRKKTQRNIEAIKDSVGNRERKLIVALRKMQDFIFRENVLNLNLYDSPPVSPI